MVQVLFGITGGIAAFKATSIIRLLTEKGHSVKVIPTQNALRFIGATTLEALSHNTVDEDLYTDVDSVKHVKLGQEADLIVVAPASASFLARYASGIADDLLGNALLASKAPVVVAPAMHTEMWQHESTVSNVQTLRARGVHVLEPDSGRLTGTDSGPGRLPEPEAIVSAALAILDSQSEVTSKLKGKHVIITAGGTREPIDPVRFIGNSSSGKQGVALAHAAQAAGAKVTLIGANLEISASGIQNFISVSTAAQLHSNVLQLLDSADVLIMAAAVSDYRVEHPSSEKIKKTQSNQNLELRLVSNPDILAESVQKIQSLSAPVLTVGFAAETAPDLSRLAALAEIKLASKGCDLIVANDVSGSKVFGSDETSVYIVGNDGSSSHASGSKLQVASEILKRVAARL